MSLMSLKIRATAYKVRRQSGAALLLAMLTVTLVAGFSASALWQQWQALEIETAERTRVQASWILTGAADWARLILVEDARTGGPDYLSEPWAQVFQEIPLSSLLSADKNTTASSGGAPDGSLSGQIQDMQARLNVLNLIDGDKVSQADLQAFSRLFTLLGLPLSELRLLAENLGVSSAPGTTATIAITTSTPISPQHVRELALLGLSRPTITRLAPYISVLPVRSVVNLNTAGVEVIYASVPGLEVAQARRLVEERTRSPFRNLEDARRLAAAAAERITEARHSVGTRFFEVSGRLQLDKLVVEERTLMQREGVDVKTLWREKGALNAP